MTTYRGALASELLLVLVEKTTPSGEGRPTISQLEASNLADEAVTLADALIKRLDAAEEEP